MEEDNWEGDSSVIAFLLLSTANDKTEQVLEHLRNMKEVEEAYIIYGEWDLLCKVRVESLSKLTKLVMRMRKFDGVNKTSTLITLSE